MSHELLHISDSKLNQLLETKKKTTLSHKMKTGSSSVKFQRKQTSTAIKGTSLRVDKISPSTLWTNGSKAYSSATSIGEEDLTYEEKVERLEEIFKVRGLVRRKAVVHYTFRTMAGWQDYNVPRDQESRIHSVLAKMPSLGKLDVIVMHRQTVSSVVGSPEGETNPHDCEKDGGSYLLTNGGFFIPRAKPVLPPLIGPAMLRTDWDGEDFEQEKHKFYAVGQTSSCPQFFPVPKTQESYYQRFTADDGTFFSSGPRLKLPLDLSLPILNFSPPYADTVIGGVHTASDPNERLVYVLLRDGTKIIFVYTCQDRFQYGCDLNEMREIMDNFLQSYCDTCLEKTHTALNLDGGSSIYVSWKEEGRRPRVIAIGSLRMKTPLKVSRPKNVTNMIKFMV